MMNDFIIETVDALREIYRNPKVATLFLVSGMDVTFRIRRTAKITSDPKILKFLEINGKEPNSAIAVRIKEAFQHCGKALIRLNTWNLENRVTKGTFPPPGICMLIT